MGVHRTSLERVRENVNDEGRRYKGVVEGFIGMWKTRGVTSDGKKRTIGRELIRTNHVVRGG